MKTGGNIQKSSSCDKKVRDVCLWLYDNHHIILISSITMMFMLMFILSISHNMISRELADVLGFGAAMSASISGAIVGIYLTMLILVTSPIWITFIIPLFGIWLVVRIVS